ncbi:helix-turn-helix domain-containing protein [Spirosoma fluviale]|uniref:Helix-turn-helix n=1 Tax=Spirosoma fluviale TaxID=1597977 RepID=A0A286GW42_9BACT|nr:helix-turn-helix transcriptional regulator [Spirosoma fluviale]SOD99740.1 Helix-turn-helix [Spirosoma fluviale]
MHQYYIIDTVKNRRDVLHITQEYLAELSGVSLRTIKQIESGKGNPTVETLSKLADVLGMELTLVIKQLNP